VIAITVCLLALCAVLIKAAWDYYPHEVSRLKLEIGTKANSDFQIRTGGIAFWNDRLVYATWDGDKHIVILDTKDGSILAKVPVDINTGTPGPIIHSSNGHLYLMYFDQTKGWCLADVSEKGAAVKPIFPGAGYSLINDTWHPLPSRDPYITWRLADFQIRYDGELEGLASVYVVDPDDVAIDPDGTLFADYWFETKGEKINFFHIRQHRGMLPFELMPSVKQFPSGIVIQGRVSFLIQEMEKDKLGRISIGAEKEIYPEMESEGTTRGEEQMDSFAVARGYDDSKLYLLFNSCQLRKDVEPLSDDDTINEKWRCIAVDRTTFKVEEDKLMGRRANRFRYSLDRHRIDRCMSWTILLGGDWDYGPEMLLAYNPAQKKLKAAEVGAGFFDFKKTQVFVGCGIAFKSPEEAYLAYLRRFGPSEDNLQTELRIYRLKLP
jgi:hypothetical protein